MAALRSPVAVAVSDAAGLRTPTRFGRSPARNRDAVDAAARATSSERPEYNVAQWRREQAQKLHAKLEQALEEVKMEKNRCSELCATLAGVHQRSAAFDARCDELTSALEKAREEQKDAETTTAQERAVRDRFLRREAELSAQLEREEEALGERQRAARVQESAIESYLKNWPDSSGLSIQRIEEGTVRITFNFASAESRDDWEGSCTLGSKKDVSKKSVYSITDATPELPQSKVQALLDAFNADTTAKSGFPRLVVGLRKLFLDQRKAPPMARRGGA